MKTISTLTKSLFSYISIFSRVAWWEHDDKIQSGRERGKGMYVTTVALFYPMHMCVSVLRTFLKTTDSCHSIRLVYIAIPLQRLTTQEGKCPQNHNANIWQNNGAVRRTTPSTSAQQCAALSPDTFRNRRGGGGKSHPATLTNTIATIPLIKCCGTAQGHLRVHTYMSNKKWMNLEFHRLNIIPGEKKKKNSRHRSHSDLNESEVSSQVLLIYWLLL